MSHPDPDPAPSDAVSRAGARPFANPAVVSRSWFPILRSAQLGAGSVRRVDFAGRGLVLYRGRAGDAHALDARCPHLGADLSHGRLDGDGLRCAFHGWCFDADGRCSDAPGHAVHPDRRTRAYPIVERWGFIWLFNGPEPLFPLPDPAAGERPWAVRLPPQRIRCHPHLVLSNGLDVAHYEQLHGLRLHGLPHLTVSRYRVTISLRGTPISRLWRVLSGSTSKEIVASFTTVGGSLAWAAVSSPVQFDILFTGRPDRSGHCLTQTIFFFRQQPGAVWLRALGLMLTLLHDDRRVLEGLDFRPAFSDADGPLRAYAQVVNALGSW